MKPNVQQKRAAFTLVECLVVIGILGALVALAMGPGFRALKKSAASVKCVSNLRQIGTAFYLYAAENNGRLPTVEGTASGSSKAEQDGKEKQWDMQVAPYLAIKANTAKTPQKDHVFHCPQSEADPSYAGKSVVLLSYTYNFNLGKSETTPGVKLAGSPNQSSVVLLADLELTSSTPTQSFVPKMGQGKNNTIVFHAVSSYYPFLSYRHNGKINILFLDGSVAPRLRLVENDKTSPPENVRWAPDGALTGLR